MLRSLGRWTKQHQWCYVVIVPHLTNSTTNESSGQLIVKLVSPECSDVDYVPGRDALLQAGIPEENHGRFRARLLHIELSRAAAMKASNSGTSKYSGRV